ncbi:NADH:flavin oxidoreductase/NADH oxidase [Tilletiopsis washingtonensis]|uniref:NADH:flavin oxidoreductase/NADH oxidase n=1 Tax=Tilletiopsis washingtonensis TaxID=58919 RepID=A0A316Z948_9BASI|nr:NADH:flavin oxidoreductase/NADH oxidase [Tilletiopsis washingtonensis]PWN96765.1 NADH:flavin oxidoreductase/NADH oxidase [Tilletiopsis washingtonensis]
MVTDYKILGDAIALPFSGRSAPSRFMKSAMTERLSSWDQHDPTNRGIPSDELVRVYEEWGKGGWGIVVSGNLIVDTMNLEAPGNMIIHRSQQKQDELESQMRRLIAGSKAGGALFVAQLSHGGRQVTSAIQPNPVSASDVKLDDRMGMSFAKPTPLTEEGIRETVENFAYAAQKLHEWGADGVQLHAAHGYLLAQFLAPSTNQRTDKYGGSVANRARIIYEIFDAIKKRVNDPKFVLAIKINSVEFQKGGFSTEESAEVCAELEKIGVDVLELSGGTYEELAFGHRRESTKKREAFFLEFSDVIVKQLQKSTVWTTGGFRTAKAMVQAVQDGATQGIGLARPATQDFDIPRKLYTGKLDAAPQGLIPEDDFGMTNLIAGTQIRQVGKGLQPFDKSDESAVGEFKATAGKFMEAGAAAAKDGVVNAGYPDHAGSPYVPIDTAQ